MKKYILTIVYDNDADEVQSVEQRVVDLKPKKEKGDVQVSFNSRFVDNLPFLEQGVINTLFQAANDAGALMGDA